MFGQQPEEPLMPEGAPAGKSANRWLILLVLFIARAAIAFQFQSIPALSPLLVDSLQIDYALIGTLVGLYMLPGVIFSLPGGCSVSGLETSRSRYSGSASWWWEGSGWA